MIRRRTLPTGPHCEAVELADGTTVYVRALPDRELTDADVATLEAFAQYLRDKAGDAPQP